MWPLQKSIKPVFWGMSIIAAYLFISGIADHKLSLALFAGALAGLATGYVYVLKSVRYSNATSLQLFAAGVYLGFTLFGSTLRIAMHQEAVPALVTGIAAIIVLIWWIRRILARL